MENGALCHHTHKHICHGQCGQLKFPRESLMCDVGVCDCGRKGRKAQKGPVVVDCEFSVFWRTGEEGSEMWQKIKEVNNHL